jgi:ubiquinone/menaquinone biosynthesis C-methylase UbiE
MNSREVRRIRMAYAERDRTRKSIDRNPGRQRMLRERSDTMQRVLGERLERPLSECRILDVGCGSGSLLSWFHERGVPPENLFGIDLLPDRIKIARESHPAFTFIEGNAERLAFPDGWFDLVLVFTVFSSILDDAMARNVARSIGRVLKNSGVVVWHDMRYPNPWNSAVRAMTKSRIRKLFPSFELELKLIYLLPSIAYHLGRFTDWAYPILASLPVLRSHYFGLLWPTSKPVDLPERTVG